MLKMLETRYSCFLAKSKFSYIEIWWGFSLYVSMLQHYKNKQLLHSDLYFGITSGVKVQNWATNDLGDMGLSAVCDCGITHLLVTRDFQQCSMCDQQRLRSACA